MTEPTVVARSMETETGPGIEIHTSNQRLEQLLRRGTDILNSQTVDGEVMPIESWPRRLRREFGRIAAKVDGR